MANLSGIHGATTINGVVYINTTPHPINFLNGEELVVVPPCGTLVNARPVEQVVRIENGITYVRTAFKEDEASLKFLDTVQEEVPEAVVIGSIIAAQAYPGRVVGLTPAPGYERVAPAEKRMRLDKFTICE